MTSLKVQQRIRLAVYGYCSLLVSAVISTVLCFFQLDVITEQQCWEDKLGDELLSSLLWNFILWLVVYPIFTLTRSSLAKSKTTFQYSPEYDCCHFIHLALLFYTIVWLSCYFSPLIPVIGVLLFTFVFYLFKFILLQHSRCSFEPWHVGKTYSSMLTMLLVLHGMVMSIQCYVLFTMKSSQICGPFIHVKYPYEIIFQIFLAFGLKKTAVDVIFYLLKPGVIPIIITLWIGLVYYLKEKANCKTELIVKLEQHIVMEAKDKGYLLNLVKMNLNVRNAGRLPSSSMEPGGREVMLSTQG